MQKPLPKKLLSRLSSFLSTEDYQKVLDGWRVERVCSFRVNTLKSSPEEIEETLRKKDIPFRKVPFLPLAYVIDKKHEFVLKGTDIYYAGKIYVQGLASQLPATLLDLEKNMQVFDVTAAPGSKTTQISALMRNTGKIVACEKHQIRHDKLLHNLHLQGATNVETFKTDALKLCEELEQGSFDAILLDVPCSAEGRIRADDERSYGFWSVRNIEEKAILQKSLLDAVLPLLKKGGTLVYSTCTLAPEENEGVISEILNKNLHLSLEKIEGLEGVSLMSGLKSFNGTTYHPDITNTIRILPSAEMEGFYIAKIRKNF
ncbi:MAG: RsmB/NOP family class I SAM-dependent RNA methyltransferase [Candidatus Gracilibacteria bacterium]|nr:RsmB/NOP family class I SAM-dependent RNA methyltransferase [Candidatus Gracilibacteria bacterium]